jgi:rod shape determining protein RodA
MNIDFQELSNYFKVLPRHFNYLLVVQIVPLLIISSILVKEIDERLFHKQMIYYSVGAIAFVVASFVPWERILWWFAPTGYVINILLLFAVGFVGKKILGARRWLEIPGVGLTIQPSEFMKVNVILILALLISHSPPPKNGYGVLSFLKLSIIIIFPFLLIATEPDLGTALVLLLIGLGVLFVIGVKWKIWMTIIVSSIIFAPFAYNNLLKKYQQGRVKSFIKTVTSGEPNNYQVKQALIAIGSGGESGRPKDEATQTQLKFLPIASSDFIFAYLGERFGFRGMLFVILLYILLVVHLLVISRIYEKDYPIRVVSSGLAMLIFIYMNVNMYMIIGMAPVVGVPLPMFSHGGTSFIIFVTLFGILLNLIAYKKYFKHITESKVVMQKREPIKGFILKRNES